MGGKEVTLHDPTQYNTDVEVISYWSKGVITLNWSYDPYTGYKNPDWGHSSPSSALQKDNMQLADEAISVYNKNIQTYGIWKWGIGTLGFNFVRWRIT